MHTAHAKSSIIFSVVGKCIYVYMRYMSKQIINIIHSSECKRIRNKSRGSRRETETERSKKKPNEENSAERVYFTCTHFCFLECGRFAVSLSVSVSFSLFAHLFTCVMLNQNLFCLIIFFFFSLSVQLSHFELWTFSSFYSYSTYLPEIFRHIT